MALGLGFDAGDPAGRPACRYSITFARYPVLHLVLTAEVIAILTELTVDATAKAAAASVPHGAADSTVDEESGDGE